MEPPNTKKMELRAIRNIKPEEEVAKQTKQIENINAEEELINRSEAGQRDYYKFSGDCQLHHGGVQVFFWTFVHYLVNLE